MSRLRRIRSWPPPWLITRGPDLDPDHGLPPVQCLRTSPSSLLCESHRSIQISLSNNPYPTTKWRGFLSTNLSFVYSPLPVCVGLGHVRRTSKVKEHADGYLSDQNDLDSPELLNLDITYTSTPKSFVLSTRPRLAH